MDKSFDAWSAATKLGDGAIDRARRGFGEYVNEICLLICIVFTVAIPLVTVRFVNPFSPEFLANTVYMAISTYTCYLVFIPSGKRDELSNGKYTGRATWETLCDGVREKSLISSLCDYCDREAVREAGEISRRLAAEACIDADKYVAVYSKMKRDALRRELREGRLVKRQYRLLCRANAVRVRQISPALILSEAREVSINDAGRRRISYEQSAAIKKPFVILVSSVSLACAVLIPTGAIGIAVAVSIISRIFGICMASLAGYNVGVRQIRWENARTDAKILFLQRFMETVEENGEIQS